MKLPKQLYQPFNFDDEVSRLTQITYKVWEGRGWKYYDDNGNRFEFDSEAGLIFVN